MITNPLAYTEAIHQLIAYTLAYELGTPMVSDAAYDQLYQQVQLYERNNPTHIAENSPTQTFPHTNLFQPFQHDPNTPMISLANAYTRDDLTAFDTRIKKTIQAPVTYCLEPKLDGVAVSVHYDAGRLRVAATRGNGTQGDVITAHVRTIDHLPKTLPEPVTLECRGELFMTHADFHDLNARSDTPFSNPRNTVAGTLRQLDPAVSQDRRLSIIIYQGLPQTGPSIDTHHAMIQWLTELGLPTNLPHVSVHHTIESAYAGVQNFFQHASLGYDTDGCVIKVNELAAHAELGRTAKSVRWAVAYKPVAKRALTTVTAIEPQVGRTGVLTPVAHLEPVAVQGVVIQRVSLYNYDEIERLNIRPGDRVEVARAGDVIPKIMAVVCPSSDPLPPLPTQCPVCSSDVLHDGAALRCPNVGCLAQLKARLTHYASRDALNIDGLGPAIIEQLVDTQLVHRLCDLYTVSVDQFMQLDKLAEKSSRQLVDAIAATQTPTLGTFLYAMGLPGVGATVARQLAHHFQTLDALLATQADALVELDGIGERLASAIVSQLPTLRQVSDELYAVGLRIQSPTASTPTPETPFTNKTVVITGTLATLSRKDAEAMVLNLGGQIGQTVSKKTDIVVVGESAGSKAKKAADLQAAGVPIVIWDDATFCQKLNS